ncbi:MAG: thioredoxin family protein [Saprospiraceae bacterium]|nr:thioredoxin family protein [Saprospiraceae bacterium]
MLNLFVKNSSFLSLAMLIFFAFSACAQKPATNPAENEGWITSLDQAVALSKKSGKPILANFTGSDWCGWCKRLTAAVFVKEEFKTWAAKNVILLELDFPRFKQIPADLKAQNQALQQQFQVGGFPTIWVFDANQNKSTKQYEFTQLGRTGYKPTVQEFTGDVDQMLARRKK